MISYSVDGVLLDIEGTTSSIDFVYQQMFPYVRRELGGFLEEYFAEPEVMTACRLIAVEGGLHKFAMLSQHEASRAEAVALVRTEVLRLMDGDSKSTGLKRLQGLIWRRGFESGELVAHVFPDVLPQLTAWSAAGLSLYIYSSGSIESQKLFFGHTEQGNLRRYFSGYFDTTTGPKRESTSYATIAEACRISAARFLFLSDVSAELAAASTAGFHVGLCLRSGNSPQPDAHRWPQFEDFSQIEVSR